MWTRHQDVCVDAGESVCAHVLVCAHVYVCLLVHSSQHRRVQGGLGHVLWATQ